jgi:hypothetical protein
MPGVLVLTLEAELKNMDPLRSNKKKTLTKVRIARVKQ